MQSVGSTDDGNSATETSSARRFPGLRSAGGILDRIVEKKAGRLLYARFSGSKTGVAKSPDPEISQNPNPARSNSRLSFAGAVGRRDRINVIAEIKRQSPSKGVIRQDFDPVAIAESYSRNGAAALSILTEEDFFGGSLAYLTQIREKVPDIPLLRKDFIFDECQIRESKEAGADALLLITAILGDELLSRLISATRDAGLEPLVEVHTAGEMERALRAGAHTIGVNNRDLTDFTVNLGTSIELARLAPAGKLLVSESGIKTGGDIALLRQAGFSAFLIGEHLMRQHDPGECLAGLVDAAGSGALLSQTEPY